MADNGTLHTESPLFLLMTRVLANNPDDTFSFNDFAFITNFFYRSSNFHGLNRPSAKNTPVLQSRLRVFDVLDVWIIELLMPVNNTSAAQIIRRQFDRNFVPRKYPDKMLTHFTGNMG